ncbi:MAG: hypothetical protein IJW49_03805 [Clostridia bacterium]|nr:hypothetical protein [Clostridia bacterium]
MEEKSLNPRFSVGKATLIFLGIAFIMGILNFYAYLSGSWVPMQTIEEGQSVYADLSPSMRNMFLVRVVMIALSFYIIWKNSKNYKLGLALPDNKLAFAGTIVLALVTVLFSVLKIGWVQEFVNTGLMMLLFVVTDAIFIAFGVFLLRMAGASKLLQILIPFVGNVLVAAITFGGLFALGNTYTDPMAMVKVLIFFVILSLFYAAFYVLTHRLSVAIIFAALWGIAVAAQATPEVASTAFTKYVALIASGVCILGAVASFVLTLVLKKLPSDGLWEYTPNDEGFGSNGSDIQGELHSSKALIIALLSFASAGVTFLTVLLENIEEVSLNFLEIFHNLINWNYRDFTDPFEDIVAPFLPLVMVFVAILPTLLIGLAFVNFYRSKTTKHIDKLKKGWRWMSLSLVAYIALDIAAIVLLLVQTINGVFDFIPSIVYESNYILNYFANFNFVSSMTYVAVAIVAVLLVVHIGMLLATLSIYKSGGSKTRGFQFYLLLVATVVVAIPHIALAFWFQGFVTPIIAVCDGLTVLLLATILNTTYKKN